MEKRTHPQLPILVVDDEPAFLRSCRASLSYHGINNVIFLQDSREVMPLLSEQNIGIVLLDLAMPHISGEELLSLISEEYPHVQIVIITGFSEVEIAVRCMRKGAIDYLTKPVEETKLVACVDKVIELWETKQQLSNLKRLMLSDKLDHPMAFSETISEDPKMRSILKYVETVATSSKPVLITGETGVGKELIAKTVHTLSDREGRFVVVNVAGLDDHAFSDTLFGHVRGAFTGADSDRDGLIKTASGGTLFLDEIADLSETSQIKLLRFLQEKEFFPLGSDIAEMTDARIITATNQDINAFQESGKFRKDLYYRLHNHHIHVPPLRERIRDLPVLVDHFLEKTSAKLGKKKPTPPDELTKLLATYSFPGNVRELEAMVDDAVSRHKSKMLSMETFKSYILRNRCFAPKPLNWQETALFSSSPSDKPLNVEDATNLLVLNAMVKAKGNRTIAADLLGISRFALSRKLKKSSLLRDRFDE